VPPSRGSLASLSITVSRVFLFGLLPLVLAATHVWLDERVRHRAQRLEVFMLYMLAVGVAGSGIGGFFAHAFLADEVANSVGWPAGSPFQLEVAFANLALGILGIAAMNRGDGFRDATVIAVTIFAGGATITHVIDIVETGNLAAGNTVQNVANLLRPAVLIWLLLAIRRSASAEGRAGEPALEGPWRDTAVVAAAQATAVVSASFSLGYALDQPAMGAAVGSALAAAATAHAVSRAARRHG
jgi:4-amino-4-deoxy-L-arabinose transferase-like glycosyltransferase